MDDLLGLDTWGTDLILAVQSISNDTLDSFFLAITELGNAEAFLVIMALVYWSINRQWGLRLTVLAMLSTWTNEFFKVIFRLPRPNPAIVRQLVHEQTYGFPSGHAQTGAVIVWGYLAAKVRKGWFTALAVLLIFLIGFSRVYLGVHYPQDVLAGWILGSLILVIWLHYEESLAAWWKQLEVRSQVMVIIAGISAMLFLMPTDATGHYPNETAATLAGTLLGVGIGTILENKMVQFRVDGSVGRRLLRYLVGIIFVGSIYVAGSLLPEFEPWALDIVVRVTRYSLVGLTVAWLAPLLFIRLRLADSDLNLS
ncbi:MAG: phosphatase PAP2 family protein [Chloroflexota bacterium]|nr:phosphatase PAP2 family protein [Chloroflexota bacterium]